MATKGPLKAVSMRGMFPHLSESPRSRIRITLTILDETLVKFAEWAQGCEIRAVLYAEENDLSPCQREEILTGVNGIRQIIGELRENLALEINPQRVTKNILASCLHPLGGCYGNDR
jgi:hypothetical protein